MKILSSIRDMFSNANVRKPIPPAGTPALKPLEKPAPVSNVKKPAKPLPVPPIGKEKPAFVDTLPSGVKAANEALNALPPVTHPKRTVTAQSFVNLKAPALNVGDKIAAAERLGVSVKHINMLLKVESGGSSFDRNGRPIILFEPHIFHRRTKGKWSPADFSYSKWGARPYPKSFDGRWSQLEAAALRDPVAALESASWGLFQVMGFHWQALGYESAYAFADAMASGEPAHLGAMVRFIEANGLKRALQACRANDPDSCRAFARGYNGPGFEKNRYHIKLAEALR